MKCAQPSLILYSLTSSDLESGFSNSIGSLVSNPPWFATTVTLYTNATTTDQSLQSSKLVVPLDLEI